MGTTLDPRQAYAAQIAREVGPRYGLQSFYYVPHNPATGREDYWVSLESDLVAPGGFDRAQRARQEALAKLATSNAIGKSELPLQLPPVVAAGPAPLPSPPMLPDAASHPVVPGIVGRPRLSNSFLIKNLVVDLSGLSETGGLHFKGDSPLWHADIGANGRFPWEDDFPPPRGPGDPHWKEDHPQDEDPPKPCSCNVAITCKHSSKMRDGRPYCCAISSWVIFPPPWKDSKAVKADPFGLTVSVTDVKNCKKSELTVDVSCYSVWPSDAEEVGYTLDEIWRTTAKGSEERIEWNYKTSKPIPAAHWCGFIARVFDPTKREIARTAPMWLLLLNGERIDELLVGMGAEFAKYPNIGCMRYLRTVRMIYSEELQRYAKDLTGRGSTFEDPCRMAGVGAMIAAALPKEVAAGWHFLAVQEANAFDEGKWNEATGLAAFLACVKLEDKARIAGFVEFGIPSQKDIDAIVDLLQQAAINAFVATQLTIDLSNKLKVGIRDIIKGNIETAKEILRK